MKKTKKVFKEYINDDKDIYVVKNGIQDHIDYTVKHIEIRLRNNKETNYCLKFVPFGHAIQKEGSMHIILNEFDDR